MTVNEMFLLLMVLLAVAFIAIGYAITMIRLTSQTIHKILVMNADTSERLITAQSGICCSFLKHLRDEHGLDLWDDAEAIAKYGRLPPKELEEQRVREAKDVKP